MKVVRNQVEMGPLKSKMGLERSQILPKACPAASAATAPASPAASVAAATASAAPWKC